jgi:DNA-directed RNA polymerase specialized sigma24 family protein
MIPTTQPITTRLTAERFASLAPSVRNSLLKHLQGGALTAVVADSLQQIFVELFGANRSRNEQVRFLLFAAPMARRIAIHRADPSERIGTSHISVADVKIWLSWLDTTDPLCARMIDLHYFAGASFKETATVLELPPSAVIRELRFAKRWLTVRLE